MTLTDEQKQMFESDLGGVPDGVELNTAWGKYGELDFETMHADELKHPIFKAVPRDWTIVYALKRLEAGRRNE